MGERGAVENAHHGVRRPFARKNAAERGAHAVFDHEVAQRDDDLGEQQRSEDPREEPFEREERQRAEEHGVDEATRAVQLQLGRRAGHATRQTGTPLVVVERVERAEDALQGEDPQSDDHAVCSRSRGATSPS